MFFAFVFPGKYPIPLGTQRGPQMVRAGRWAQMNVRTRRNGVLCGHEANGEV